MVPPPSPNEEDVDLFALAGVNLKRVKERVDERDHQVHQRHHERNQEHFGLLKQGPARIICGSLREDERNVLFSVIFALFY